MSWSGIEDGGGIGTWSGGERESQWKISTLDGRIDLTFTPRGLRQENLRLGVARSAFKQFYGTFSGTVQNANGEVIAIAGMMGLCEDHDSLW